MQLFIVEIIDEENHVLAFWIDITIHIKRLAVKRLYLIKLVITGIAGGQLLNHPHIRQIAFLVSSKTVNHNLVGRIPQIICVANRSCCCINRRIGYLR